MKSSATTQRFALLDSPCSNKVETFFRIQSLNRTLRWSRKTFLSRGKKFLSKGWPIDRNASIRAGKAAAVIPTVYVYLLSRT